MNKNLLIIATSVFLFSSCEKEQEVKGPDILVAQDVKELGIEVAQECVEHEPPARCPPGQDLDHPKVNLNLTTMKANPPNVCAHPGTTLTVSISPPPTKIGTVAVVPKDSADTWLVGTNDDEDAIDTIKVKIPEWVPVVTDHDYGFVTSTGQCADPRLHVE